MAHDAVTTGRVVRGHSIDLIVRSVVTEQKILVLKNFSLSKLSANRTPIFLVTASDYQVFSIRAVTSVINRYYDPSTDQFLAIDPEVARTDEPYVFVNDDPLNAEDPLGLNCDGAGSGAAIAKCEKSVQTAAAKAEGKSGGNISCGSSYDETGICPGHPGLDYDAPGPSIFTHWSFSAGVCPIVGCIAISFQNGNLQVSGGVGPALSFPGVATGYNSRQLKTGFSQSNQVFGSSPVAQISYDINGRGLSLGSGPSAESGWGGGYVHAWAYGWHL
jgi:hypothetical protein